MAFTCVWCGERVTLLVTDTGDELPDAHAFLEKHAACLHRTDTPPDQRTIQLPP